MIATVFSTIKEEGKDDKKGKGFDLLGFTDYVNANRQATTTQERSSRPSQEVLVTDLDKPSSTVENAIMGDVEKMSKISRSRSDAPPPPPPVLMKEVQRTSIPPPSDPPPPAENLMDVNSIFEIEPINPFVVSPPRFYHSKLYSKFRSHDEVTEMQVTEYLKQLLLEESNSEGDKSSNGEEKETSKNSEESKQGAKKINYGQLTGDLMKALRKEKCITLTKEKLVEISQPKLSASFFNMAGATSKMATSPPAKSRDESKEGLENEDSSPTEEFKPPSGNPFEVLSAPDSVGIGKTSPFEVLDDVSDTQARMHFWSSGDFILDVTIYGLKDILKVL